MKLLYQILYYISTLLVQMFVFVGALIHFVVTQLLLFIVSHLVRIFVILTFSGIIYLLIKNKQWNF